MGGEKAGDKFREVGRGQMSKTLWAKVNFGFYFKGSGKPLVKE